MAGYLFSAYIGMISSDTSCPAGRVSFSLFFSPVFFNLAEPFFTEKLFISEGISNVTVCFLADTSFTRTCP
jgi:hypothetical protein